MSEVPVRRRHPQAWAGFARARSREQDAVQHPPARRRARIVLGVVLGLVLLAVLGAVVGYRVYTQAMATKSSLEQAVPLAATAQDQILAGDLAGAEATVAQLAPLTADARAQSGDWAWRSLEWLPMIGDDLHAIRIAAAATDDLVTVVAEPATTPIIDTLLPSGGAVDVGAVSELASTVAHASATVDGIAAELAAIDPSGLMPQVAGAMTQLTESVSSIQPMLTQANGILEVMPAVLGADEPRTYLLVFQNTAQARSAGGIPAAFALVTADDGRFTITQQASTADFRNWRDEPIVALDPGLETLYGDKAARKVQNATMSPSLDESADVIRAYWAESFGTPVDAVVMFDPIALSYLLQATGPLSIAPDEVMVDDAPVFGDPITISSDNAAQVLLYDAYARFDDRGQDAFFSAVARAVFEALTAGDADPQKTLDALAQAVDERRLLYSPGSDAEVQLIADTNLSGRLPSSNADRTVVGVYANDVTGAKMGTFLQLDVAAASSQCTDPESPTFTTTATLTNTVTSEQVPGLPWYIDPPLYFARGTVATDLVFYGPVGSTFAGATVDGKPVDGVSAEHLDRGAVRIFLKNRAEQAHTVVVTFTSPAGDYGTFELQHTPMVHPVGVELTAEGCGQG